MKTQPLAQFPFFLHILQPGICLVLVLLALSAVLPKLINPPLFTEVYIFSSHFHPLFLSLTIVLLLILFAAKMTLSQERELWML